LWDALRMNMMISYQELVRTFPSKIKLGVPKNIGDDDTTDFRFSLITDIHYSYGRRYACWVGKV
uniref:hypothetical protein n=1 Tax=Escherichia coli TaxID=562 RepID=UPI00235FBF88